MKIVFIQRDAYEKMGVHQLMGALQGQGHHIDLFIHELEPHFYDTVVDFRPDFVLYSLYIGEESFMLEAFSEIKRRLPGVKTLVGGPFTCVFPEIIGRPGVDFMIRGDGEEVLPAFLRCWFNGATVRQLPGIGFTEPDGAPFIHPEVNLIGDLSCLPAPRRDLYYKYPLLRNRDTKIFVASRGCPFSCSYCYNTELKKCVKGKYWRLKAINSVLDEIEDTRERYGLRWVHFQDGTFNADKRWLISFLSEYRQRGLPPFLCNCRADQFDEIVARELKAAGCDRITFGIQSGNQHVRSQTAKRSMTDEQILNAFALCRKYGIRTGADIIFGWPGETVLQAMDTIRFCRKIKADSYHSNVLIPYPGITLTRDAVNNGYLYREPTMKEIGALTANRSLVDQKNINLLINMDKLFYYLIRFPRAEKLIKCMLKLPPNRFYNSIKNLHLLKRSLQYDAQNARDALRMITRHLSLFWRGETWA